MQSSHRSGRRRVAWGLVLSAAMAACSVARGDGPKDNVPDNVRPIPPVGIAVPDAEKAELEKGVGQLGKEIEVLRESLKGKPELLALLPDVQIYHNAVQYALKYNEFIPTNDKQPGKQFELAKQAIKDGLERAANLREGKAPWVTGGGPRGYVSRIDGSVQPFLLSVPASYKPGEASKKYRLDFSEHGRNEKLTELNFISQMAGKDHTIGGSTEKFVVQLYGRFCCANKFAGEIDLFEALDAMKRQYPIDEDRILNIGFSMGGAACWQFAVHYTDAFACNSPGAGFAETREFLHNFQNEAVQPTWYEKKLWAWYDCTDYAANLFNGRTIAYSGELDGQKQSADIMEKYAAEEGLKLERIIGPNTKHAYEKNAKIELDKRIDEQLAKGRDPVPAKIRFTTWTLRYNKMFWVTLDGLERHWSRARADGEIKADGVDLRTSGVTALTVAFPDGKAPFNPGTKLTVTLDGAKLELPAVGADKNLTAHFIKLNGEWHVGQPMEAALRKRPGLQGPIDDAFMDGFMIVKPTGKPLNEQVGKWENEECQHAIDHWRKQFRGDARVKTADEVTPSDVAANNLVLFGDPSSNPMIAKILEKLPVKWNGGEVAIGGNKFPADHHALIAIYPNPMNPKKYVVLNSGFTYREYDYLNNARQVPKLPDYAVVDVSVPVSSRAPGGIVDAGFFGEKWELLADGGK
jgi:hypothetical protein